MRNPTGRRKARRHNCDALIKWVQFNRIASNYGQAIFYRAKLLNFSTSGMYFESEYPLKPGATVLSRTEAYLCGNSDTHGCECLRTISLADIKWCQAFVKNGETHYGFGAKYPIPY